MTTHIVMTNPTRPRPAGRQGLRLRSAIACAMAFLAGTAGAAQGTGPERQVVDKAAASSSHGHTASVSPESPRQLWERLLQLLAEDKGYTPKDRVEAVLGIRFTEVEEETEPPTVGAKHRYSLKSISAELGEFSAGLFDDPRKTALSLSWGKKYAQSEHCLSVRALADDLVAAGWVQLGMQSGGRGPGGTDFGRATEIQRIRELGRGFDDSKGDSWIILVSPFVPSDCVNGISIRVSRHPTR